MSDGKVVDIKGQPLTEAEPQVDQAVVDMLETMLAHAKTGKLIAFFAVGCNADRSIMSGWQGAHKAAFTLLGGVQQLMHEFVHKEFERR
jgi:hypothetical protein